MAEPDFRIWVIPPDKPGEPTQVTLRASSGDIPLASLGAAAQYMMHLFAQRNPAGYEKSLEVLMAGAMSWNEMKIEGKEN
ncbi:hypothetical protein LCGC14_1769260 [marine sediment metagenome]|uniref:Uncharacterized protein n=1 Tax=marine sediment metagenome TaxID=412755 RepID=A0A0F9HLB0_9ZZZZ